jgi:ketosteroid isomerase-like protein
MPTTRRSVLAAAAPALATAAGLSRPPDAHASRPDAAADPVVRSLVERATQAHAALMVGDVTRYRSFISTPPDFTLMSPFGGKPTRGTELTDERWVSVGRFFRNGRDATLELVQAYRGADMVVLAVIERGHAEVGGLQGQDWALRVTLVFRQENGQWLLAHRHADPIVEGISLEEAAKLGGRRAAA